MLRKITAEADVLRKIAVEVDPPHTQTVAG